MKVFSSLLCMALASSFIVGCAKDKNMQDYQSEQVQTQISKINAVSGVYSGEAVSNLDGTVLGAIKLNFTPSTVVQSGNSTNVNTTQTVSVSGQVNLSGLSTASVSFNNGSYNDLTGDFQVTIAVTLIDGKTNKNIDLKGHISGDQFIGSLSVDQDQNYQAILSLTKNAPATNINKLEIAGARIHQIARTNLSYVGDFSSGNESVSAQLYFGNRDTAPDLQFYKLVSAKRLVDANIANKYYTLSFPNSTIDDNLGTIDGSSTATTLHCDRFENGKSDSGFDCVISGKLKPIRIHLSAQAAQ